MSELETALSLTGANALAAPVFVLPGLSLPVQVTEFLMGVEPDRCHVAHGSSIAAIEPDCSGRVLSLDESEARSPESHHRRSAQGGTHHLPSSYFETIL
jgi:hypothetical protein